MTVERYETKSIWLVENPQDKVQKSRDGLKSDLQNLMILLNIMNDEEVYEWAQVIERDQLGSATTSG